MQSLSRSSGWVGCLTVVLTGVVSGCAPDPRDDAVMLTGHTSGTGSTTEGDTLDTGSSSSSTTSTSTSTSTTTTTTTTTGETATGESTGSGDPCVMDGQPVDCDDGNPCTIDICSESEGGCVHTSELLNGTDCSDGEPCTIEDTCHDGVCEGSPLDCDDGVPCTMDACDEATQSCLHVPDDAACSDDDACTGTETCDAMAGCQAGLPVVCNDTNACTTDTCDPQSGQCDFATNVGQPCVEAEDQCNTGMCDQNGDCVAVPVADGQPCDDASFCTQGETCQGGTCTPASETTTCQNDDQCCPAACDFNTDNDCSCDNLGELATPTHSGGGSEATGYGPSNLADGIDEAACVSNLACSQCFAWVQNGQTPTGAYFQYTWAAPQTIGGIYVETENATNPVCGTTGRNIEDTTIQWWDGNAWVTETMVAGETDDFFLTFNPPLSTDRLRLYDIVASPGNGNSLVFEWYVYTSAACIP